VRVPKIGQTIFVTEHKWKSLNYIKTAREKKCCINNFLEKIKKSKIWLKIVKYE